MRVIHDLSVPAFPGERAVITIGAYDGVHRGHQAVIAEVRRQPIETLSKGYRQRVGFAQAVLHDPPALEDDEAGPSRYLFDCHEQSYYDGE